MKATRPSLPVRSLAALLSAALVLLSPGFEAYAAVARGVSAAPGAQGPAAVGPVAAPLTAPRIEGAPTALPGGSLGLPSAPLTPVPAAAAPAAASFGDAAGRSVAGA